MLLRLKLLAIVFSSSALLLFVLCLGSQNLKDRQKINLGASSTAALPTGFALGISLIMGVVSGGSIAGIIIPSKKDY